MWFYVRLFSVILLVSASFYWLYRNRKKVTGASAIPEEATQYLQNIDVEKERKARKTWLITFSILSVAWPLLFFLAAVIFSLVSFILNGRILLLSFSIFGGLSFLFPQWLIYHFAYKKRGTNLLLCQMILMAFILSYSAIDSFMTSAEFPWPGYLILFAIFGFYEIVAFRLYKVNLARKKQLSLLYKTEQEPTPV